MILKGTRYPDYGHFSNLLIYTQVKIYVQLLFGRVGLLKNARPLPKWKGQKSSTHLPGKEKALLGNDKINIRSGSL